MSRLADKRVIITGATGGIGKATAAAFLEQGAKLMLVSRSADRLAAMAAALDGGDKVAVCAADISEEEECRRYVDETMGRYGGIDVLFANAGTEGSIKPLIEMPAEEFDKVILTNVRGSYLSLKHVIPQMINGGGGSIIITSSVAGRVGVPGLSAYATSKHAIIGLAQVAALEYAEHGVRVNAIAPAPVDNEMMRSIEKQAAPGAEDQARAGFEGLVAMKRYATNEEVAGLVTFLASDESGFCTGGVYAVDGGFLAA